MTKETAAEGAARTGPDYDGGLRFLRGNRLFLLGRLALGFIFIFASIDKILNPAAFSEVISNYQLLPDQAINFMAIVLPWLELILGALLVAGLWLPGVVALATLLLVVFFLALLISLARGLDIQCGCFSTGAEGKPQMLWTLARDALFLSVSFYLSYRTLFRRAHCPQ